MNLIYIICIVLIQANISISYYSSKYMNTITTIRIKYCRRLFSSSNSKHWSNYPSITSNSNDRIKLIESLNIKKFRDKNQLILIEGHRQVIDALSYKLIPHSIILSDQSLQAPLGFQLRNLLDDIDSSKIRLVDDKVMKSLSDTITNQGVIAVFNRPNKLSSNHVKDILSKSTNPLIVITDEISDPGNLGTLIRSSYGFGADILITIGGCDVWSPKVLRGSMSAALKLPVAEWSWNDVNEFITTNKFQILVTDVDANSKPFDTIDFSLSSIIVIGSEARGVSTNAKELNNMISINIPMDRPLESLNAAVAGAAILSEVSRQRRNNKSKLQF